MQSHELPMPGCGSTHLPTHTPPTPPLASFELEPATLTPPATTPVLQPSTPNSCHGPSDFLFRDAWLFRDVLIYCRTQRSYKLAKKITKKVHAKVCVFNAEIMVTQHWLTHQVSLSSCSYGAPPAHSTQSPSAHHQFEAI